MKIIITLLFAISAFSQTQKSPGLITGTGAPSAALCKVLGQMYFQTDAAAGSNLFGCTTIATTWTLLGGGGSSSGALVLLASLTASSSASLDFATRNATGQSGTLIQSDYDDYIVQLINVKPSSNDADLKMRISTNGGSSYNSLFAYSSAFWAFRAGSGNGAVSGLENAEDALKITVYGVSNQSSAAGVVGIINVYAPQSTFAYKHVIGEAGYFGQASTYRIRSNFLATFDSTSAYNAFQFLFEPASNIASGTIRVYGVAK